MNKTIKIIFLGIVLSFIFQTYTLATVAYVNLDNLISNSNIGKNALKKINDLDKQNVENLKKKNKELKDFESDLKTKKNIISDEAFQAEVNKLKKKIKDFNNEKNDMIQNLNQFKKKELDNVFDQITPIIKTYMDENSIKIIMDSKNIFMGKTEIDLTDKLLNIINQKLN